MSPEKSIKPDAPKPEAKAAPVVPGTISASAPVAAPSPAPAATAQPLASLPPAQRSGVATIPVSAPANNTFSPVNPPVAALGTPAPDRVGPPAPNLVASAAPTAASAAQPAAPASTLKLLSREQPNFPPQAYRAGVTKGHVKVRMMVNPDGSVGSVEVLEATPRGIFEKAVVAAAERWKYAPITEPQSTIAEFDFHSE